MLPMRKASGLGTTYRDRYCGGVQLDPETGAAAE
jgi:hypothetical protein